jgi:transposase
MMKSIREEIVAQYLSGAGTYRELAARYGIKKSTVHYWVSRARRDKEGADASVLSREPEQQDQSIEVRHLKEELRRSELHNKLLNAMIDIAEEQLGVDIRKKPGSRQ